MECNKDEAIKAKEIAERKMENNEFEGAHKIALKAQRLYPELENINQMLTVCSVHCSASTNILGLDKDWYGILQVDKLTDEVSIKKQYRKLALVLHPDKNKFPGAESAFKLIGEANMVLSDKIKRSAYDAKLRVSQRGGSSAKAPPQQVNPAAARPNFAPNGFNPQFNTHPNPNLHNARPTQPPPDKTFWTSCPYCAVRYQYRKEVVNRAVRCQNCAKPFIAYDVGSNNFSSRFGPRPPTQQYPVTNQATAPPTVNPSGFPFSQPESVPQRGNTSQVFEDLKSKEKGGVPAPKKAPAMPHGARVKNRKRIRKQNSSESSESSDTTSSDTSVDFEGNLGGINPDHVRRSSRRRHDVSYNENEGDDLHSNKSKTFPDGKSQEHVAAPPESKPKVNPDIPNGSEKVEVVIDSESDSEYADEDPVQTLAYPDPEFHDFDKDKEESCFAADQLWACYDTEDGMPRFYAHIKKIFSHDFGIQFNWLEIHPDDRSDNDWVNSDLPVACGKFKRGKSEFVDNPSSFSHKMQWEKGKKGAYIIYPRKGEIWAVFRGWDISWSYEPHKHKPFKYAIVEILSYFVPGSGIRVGYLNKLDGYVSLFQSETCSSSSFMVRPNELYMFSHKVPFFKLSGTERDGVPAGAFELDPASLPQNLDDIWYPQKSQNGQPNVKPIDVIDDDEEGPKVQKSTNPESASNQKQKDTPLSSTP